MINFLKSPAFLVLAIGVSISCSAPKEAPKPLPFDASNSEPAAVELADSIEMAAGGRRAREDTRYISWTSSTGRNVYWDKGRGRARIESPEKTVYLLNLFDTTARVLQQDQESGSKEDGLKALSLFTEESHDLLLPFLLKQHGAKLVYMGEDSLSDGTIVNVLNFSQGKDSSMIVTVSVGVSDNLIKHVAKGTLVGSTKLAATWDNYKKYNNLVLSADRSDGLGPKKVSLDPIAEDRFENF
jgi:hypothetical protein